MALRNNMLANAAGVAGPLLAALVSIPVLIAQLGLPRFGVLSLLMAGLTYASIVELGLPNAILYRLAPTAQQGEPIDLDMVRSSLTTLLLLGCGLGIVGFLVAPLLGRFEGLQALPGLAEETVTSVRVLATVIPAMFAASLGASVLAAHGRFVAINKARVPLGMLTYAAPAVVSCWRPDLVSVCVALAVTRVALAAIHLAQCQRLLPALWRRFPQVSTKTLATLLPFGGWLTLSNLVGPFMVYMDRFYIGVISSAEEVARYVTPYEVATKISLLPAAVLPVLFPLFVRLQARPSAGSAHAPLAAATWTAIACALPAAALAVFAPEIIRTWLGGALATDSIVVLQILAAAVFVNCLAQVFLLQVQARGRTDIVARMHCAELAFYIVMLWWFTSRYGIVGVALAWAIRVVVDAAALCWLAASPLEARERAATWRLFGVVLAYAGALGCLALVQSLELRSVLLLPPLLLAWRRRHELHGLVFEGQREAGDKATWKGNDGAS